MADIVVPSAGESITDGILAKWLVANGDQVSQGDEVFEFETDKATLAATADVDGVVEILVEEGSDVDVGQVVGRITAGAVAAQEKASQPAPQGATGSSDGAPVDVSPAVRRLLAQYNLDPADIPGSGPKGAILKEDVLKVVEGKPDAEAPLAQGPSTPAPAPKAPAVPTAQVSKPSSGQAQERVPMTNLRKKIASKLVESQHNAAHLSTFNEVDMYEVKKLRSKYKDQFEKKHGVRLGFMSFFIKAAQKALERFPEVNAFIDGTDIVYNHYYNIGVAISSDKGLITPVIRDVDQLGFAQVEQAIIDYATKAKEKKLLPDALMGGTFTISNGGVFGSMLSTPIPNPPQTAVLGMHSITDRPMVVNGEIAIRPMMYLALTYDHRILDGREAIGFLKYIKDLIEDPGRFLLDL